MSNKLCCDADSESYHDPRVNFDILRLVCNRLTDVSDVLSFSLTCSTLREGALQRRLRMSPVVLPYLNSIEKFHSFVFEDPDGRAPHIYGLELPDFEYDFQMDDSWLEGINDCLVALLEAAIHLEYLHFPSLDFGHIVLTAVENLTTLRELSVCSNHFGRKYLFKLLTSLRSPLRCLHVETDLSASFLHHHMAQFAPTLEILESDQLSFDIPPPDVTTQFTALRSLKAEYVHDSYQLEILLRLFPNLNNSLVLSNHIDENITPDAYPALRERNKEAQKVHAWPRLDRLVCEAEAAFLMALQCPIRRMDIDGVVLPQRKQFLVETLRDNTPRQLHSSLLFCDGVDGLDGLFPLEAADKLTHLVIFAELRAEYQQDGDNSKHVPWDQLLDGLNRSMQHLHLLTHLRIVLDYQVRQSGTPTQAQLDLSRSLYTASEGDLHRAAIPFFNSLPALQHLFLTTCGYTSSGDGRDYSLTYHRPSSQAWRAVRTVEDLRPSSGAERTCLCTTLSSAETEAVIGREELHLSSSEQAMLLSFYRDSPLE